MTLEQQLEAILFALGEPLSVAQLANLTKTEAAQVEAALATLKEQLSGRGIQLVQSHQGYTFGTHPDASPLLDTIRKDELGKDLSKASLETLAIILYYNGATRSDIDFIRGVNSNFILRNLVMRGLIERTEYAEDSRKSFYVPTVDLMNHLGITSITDLPDYASIHTLFVERNTALLKTTGQETAPTETEAA